MNRVIRRCMLAFAVCVMLPITACAMDWIQITIPPPSYGIRLEADVQVPMRDGVRLATDLYVPDGAAGPLPVILIRTPYDKGAYRQSLTLSPDQDYPPRPVPSYWAAAFFAARGYVVAVQDMRGKHASAGVFFPYAASEGEDGYDTVDWLAAQPWSNGRIGTLGCSYLGEAQHMLAAARHPSHKASIAAAGSSSRGAGGVWNFGFTRYGALELAAALSWNQRFGATGGSPPQVALADTLRALHTLPVIGALRSLGATDTQFENWLIHSNEPDADYWQRQGLIGADARFDVPTIHINSWYDITPNATLALYDLYTRQSQSGLARAHQYLIMAAATHCNFESPAPDHTVGDRPVGNATLNFPALYWAWFEHWLNNQAAPAIRDMPKVMSFAMGRGVWRTAEHWPLPNTVEQRWYLHSDGTANIRLGSGQLLTVPPDIQSSDHFTYDPADPVPSVGGSICCVGPEVKSGGVDQRQVELRPDVLVYTSAALEHGVEVAGPVTLTLYVSSDVRDTDFVAKLVDVYPDGTAYIVQEGILRARWRNGFGAPVWMEPGQIYPITVDMEATHNYFAPGHRIRVDISSSSFPRWDRNLNTGGNNYDEATGIVASNAVHHSAAHPSHLTVHVLQHSAESAP